MRASTRARMRDTSARFANPRLELLKLGPAEVCNCGPYPHPFSSYQTCLLQLLGDKWGDGRSRMAAGALRSCYVRETFSQRLPSILQYHRAWEKKKSKRGKNGGKRLKAWAGYSGISRDLIAFPGFLLARWIDLSWREWISCSMGSMILFRIHIYPLPCTGRITVYERRHCIYIRVIRLAIGAAGPTKWNSYDLHSTLITSWSSWVPSDVSSRIWFRVLIFDSLLDISMGHV